MCDLGVRLTELLGLEASLQLDVWVLVGLSSLAGLDVFCGGQTVLELELLELVVD